MRTFHALICLAAFAVSCHGPSGEEDTIAASELPQPVTEGILKLYPDATVISANTVTVMLPFSA